MSCRVLSGFLLLGSLSPAVAVPSQASIARLLREDRCQTVAGYSDFRRTLERVTASRDVRGLQQLFHPRGSMRVHGVYMSATAADADPVRFAPVFDAIDDILKRGCVRNGERLILPGIAILAEQSLPTETLVVVRPSWFYLHSDGGRRIQLKPGQILTDIEHGDRWTRVTMGKRIGRVPTRDVRNPYDTRIEAAWAGDRWTIIEFGSGI